MEKKGEARTKNILLDHFIVHKIEPDIEGRDFMAELHNNISSVYAIIQSKYFENGNEVEEGFNHESFYQSVISKSIENPKQFIDSYLKFFSPISETKKILSIFYAKSPYTGILEPLRGNLNNLVEVFITLNDNSLLEKQVIQDIIKKYPYYNFIFNLDNFKKGNHFDKFWILENQTEIVLKHIAKKRRS